jgi:hypothetical protein
MIPVPSNSAVEQTVGSDSLAAAAHCERWARDWRSFDI